MLASFIAFLTNLFVGPTLLFPFPNTVYILALGQILRGLFDPLILIPALPEMIDQALPLYPKQCEGKINDISSGLFNMFLGIG